MVADDLKASSSRAAAVADVAMVLPLNPVSVGVWLQLWVTEMTCTDHEVVSLCVQTPCTGCFAVLLAQEWSRWQL